MTRLALVALALLAVPGTALAACDGIDNCLGIYFDQGEWTQTCYEPPLFMPFHVYFVLQNCTFDAIGGIGFGWRYLPLPAPVPFVLAAVFLGLGPPYDNIHNIIYDMGVAIPIDGPVVILDLTLMVLAPTSAALQLGPSTPTYLPGHAAINDWYDPENIVPLSFGAPVDAEGWTVEGVARLGDCDVPIETADWGTIKALFR